MFVSTTPPRRPRRSAFVDVAGSMIRPDLPLTLEETDEWGDALGDVAAWEAIKGFCPYEGLTRGGGSYPPTLLVHADADARVPCSQATISIEGP